MNFFKELKAGGVIARKWIRALTSPVQQIHLLAANLEGIKTGKKIRLRKGHLTLRNKNISLHPAQHSQKIIKKRTAYVITRLPHTPSHNPPQTPSGIAA